MSSSQSTASSSKAPGAESEKSEHRSFPFHRQQRSNIWDCFKRVGKAETECCLCGKKLVYKGGTSSMWEHIKRVHHEKTESIMTPEATSSTSSSIASYFSSSPASRTCSPSTSKKITDLIVDWLTVDLRPLVLVQDDGFRRLMSFLCPDYVVPSATHVTKLVKERHAEGKKELGQLIKDNASACSLTSDAWSSRANQAYNTVTCHFIDKEWSLTRAVLETSHFPGNHTADNIAAKVRQSLEGSKIDTEKFVSFVHDEAANAEAAGRKLREDVGWSSQTCAAHLLQTSVRHAIDGSKPLRRLLRRGRRLVAHFRHSNLETEALLQKERQMELKPLKLVQDVATRWNSSFYMLERLLKLRLPFMAVLTSSNRKKTDKQLLLTDKEWGVADEFVEILKPLEAATTALSGRKYVSSSLVIPVITSIEQCLKKIAHSYQDPAVSFAHHLATELRKKFHLSKLEPHTLLVLSAALDPRFRTLKYAESTNVSPDEIKQAVKISTMAVATNGDDEGAVSEPPPAKRIKTESSALDVLFSVADVDSTDSCLSSDVETEVHLFFTEKAVPTDTDPLEWWKRNQVRYPYLAELARKVLCQPATSVPSEEVFSAYGLLVSKLRASLSPTTVDAMIFLSKNGMLRAARSAPEPNPPTAPTAARRASASDEEPDLPNLNVDMDSSSDEEA